MGNPAIVMKFDICFLCDAPQQWTDLLMAIIIDKPICNYCISCDNKEDLQMKIEEKVLLEI